MTATAQRFVQDRPYPVATLARALALDPADRTLTSQLVLRLRLDRRWVRRCIRLGLTSAGAEHWATLAGLHPTQVWAGWTDDIEPDEHTGDDPPLEQCTPRVLRDVPTPPWRQAAS